MNQFQNLSDLIASCRESQDPDWNSLEDAVFERLRSAAYRITNHSDASVSFGATSLTNETVLRLIERDYTHKIRDVRHFFALMTVMMKQVFADHHASKNSWKAGGRMERVPFDAVVHSLESSAQVDYGTLVSCLDELKSEHPSEANALEMQLFTAMKVDEIAEVMELSKSAVEARLRFAKAFVRQQLNC